MYISTKQPSKTIATLHEEDEEEHDVHIFTFPIQSSSNRKSWWQLFCGIQITWWFFFLQSDKCYHHYIATLEKQQHTRKKV